MHQILECVTHSLYIVPHPNSPVSHRNTLCIRWRWSNNNCIKLHWSNPTSCKCDADCTNSCGCRHRHYVGFCDCWRPCRKYLLVNTAHLNQPIWRNKDNINTHLWYWYSWSTTYGDRTNLWNFTLHRLPFSKYLAILAKSLPNKIPVKFHLLRKFPQNSICSGLGLDSDSLGIPPFVCCNTKWLHTNTKRKSHLLVWMRQSHAMNNFCLFLLVAHKTMSRQACLEQAHLVTRNNHS